MTSGANGASPSPPTRARRAGSPRPVAGGLLHLDHGPRSPSTTGPTGSGLDASSGIVERDEALLDNGDGTCDAFPGSWSSITLSGGNDTSVVTGTVLPLPLPPAPIRVGNQATSAPSPTAKIDTSVPAVPSLSYGSFSNAIVNLGVVYYRPSAPSGQFAVTALSSDGQSGVAGYSFPAAASGWSASGSGDTRTYGHSGSPSDPAEPNNVTATNGAALTSGADSFTVTPDGTPPARSSATPGPAPAAGTRPTSPSACPRSTAAPASTRSATRPTAPTRARSTARVYSSPFNLSVDDDRPLPRLRPARQRRGRRPAR